MNVKLHHAKSNSRWFIEIDGVFSELDGKASTALTGFLCCNVKNGVFTDSPSHLLFIAGYHHFSVQLPAWEPDIWENPLEELLSRCKLVRQAFDESVESYQ